MDFRKDIRTPLDLALWRSAYVNYRKDSKHFDVAEVYANSRLYFFTHEMSQVVDATMGTVFDPAIFEMLPTKSGLLWFDYPLDERLDKPAENVSVPGIHWNMTNDGLVIEPVFYMEDFLKVKDRTYKGLVGAKLKSFQKEFKSAPHPSWGMLYRGESLSTMLSRTGGNVNIDVAVVRLFAASLVLMQSKNIPSTVNTPVGVPAQNKRRPFRDVVSVVNLRHIEHRVATEHNGRKLTVRFIVGGHFRNQPYKNGEVKRIFIDPYIKGPIGAPMKQSRPVYKF